MSTYLEEAAEQLRKLAADRRWALGDLREPDVETRKFVVEGFTRLAAIERGLLPPELAGEDMAAALAIAVLRTGDR